MRESCHGKALRTDAHRAICARVARYTEEFPRDNTELWQCWNVITRHCLLKQPSWLHGARVSPQPIRLECPLCRDVVRHRRVDSTR
jgi:hypothetical protein